MSLVSGPLPLILTGSAIVGLALLVILPPRWSWWLRAAVVLAICALVVLGADLYIERVWRPFPDPLPLNVLVWSWVGLCGLVLAALHLIRRRWAAPVAAVLAVLGAFAGINLQYGYYPDVQTALGLNKQEITDLSFGKVPTVAAPEGGYLSDVWSGSAAGGGTLSKVEIPGTESGFDARPGLVYLPASYRLNPRPLLPVVVLLAGQPGAPQMWIDGGQIVEALDRYAAAHNGLAPIVVLPDVLGSDWNNTMCIDSPKGNAETYLARDVPAFVAANLQAATGPRHWAIGGLSFGGTCGLQLAVRKPDVYGRFLSISGDRELEWHGREGAIFHFFGNDAAHYTRHNPPDILAAQRFPDTAARLVVGRDDGKHADDARRLAQECRRAGMDVSLVELPGRHSWAVWRPGFEQSLGWLAAQTGLVRS